MSVEFNSAAAVTEAYKNGQIDLNTAKDLLEGFGVEALFDGEFDADDVPNLDTVDFKGKAKVAADAPAADDDKMTAKKNELDVIQQAIDTITKVLVDAGLATEAEIQELLKDYADEGLALETFEGLDAASANAQKAFEALKDFAAEKGVSKDVIEAETAKIAEVIGVDKPEGVDKVDGDKKVDDAKLAELTAKKEELQANYNAIMTKVKTIQDEVKKLTDEVEDYFANVAEKSKKLEEEEKERVKKVYKDQIEQFKDDIKNGKNVTIDELKSSLKTALQTSGFSDEMSDLLSGTGVAEAKINMIKNYMGDLGKYSGELKNLDQQIGDITSEIAGLETTPTEPTVPTTPTEQTMPTEATKPTGCTDPIGFVDENGVKYEFIVDRNNDGNFNDFTEFLGAEKYFEEFGDYDENGDKVVTGTELQYLNDDAEDGAKTEVKVLVTNPDGTQGIKTLKEAFGDDLDKVSIKLDDYQAAEEGATSEVNGQELLGTFKINIGDNEYDAYSTNDSADYLMENYGNIATDINVDDAAPAGDVKDPAEPVDPADGDEKVDEEKPAENAEIKALDDYIESYTMENGIIKNLENRNAETYEALDLGAEIVTLLKDLAESAAVNKALNIIYQKEEKEKENEVKEEKAAEAEDAENRMEEAEEKIKDAENQDEVPEEGDDTTGNGDEPIDTEAAQDDYDDAEQDYQDAYHYLEQTGGAKVEVHDKSLQEDPVPVDSDEEDLSE